MRHDEFDRHFNSTRKLAFGGLITALLIKLALIGGLFWLAFYAIQAFSA